MLIDYGLELLLSFRYSTEGKQGNRRSAPHVLDDQWFRIGKQLAELSTVLDPSVVKRGVRTSRVRQMHLEILTPIV